MEPAANVERDELKVVPSMALQQLIDKHLGATFPAITLVVLRHAKPIFMGAWGWIDPYTQRHEVTLANRFDLASVSKLFTATLILQLISEGKLTLETPLSAIIPEFASGGLRGFDGGVHPFTKLPLPVNPALEGKSVDPNTVNIRHLLTHTSGLAPWRPTYLLHPIPLPDQPDPVPPHIRHASVITSVCASPFVDYPGNTVRYSDLGFMLLGECVQRLTGLPLDTAVNERIAKPLGLATLTYNPLQNRFGQVNIAPTEYDFVWRLRRCWGEVDDENACGMGGIAGHAGLYAAALDIATFGEAWRTRNSQLGISEAVWVEATRYQAGTDDLRGLGWKIYEEAVDPEEPQPLPEASSRSGIPSGYFGHTGFTGTSLRIDLKRGITIACLTNRVYYGRDPQGIEAFRIALHALFT